MSGPYAETAWFWREAGWAGVLPLPPARKGPPPSKYTGWAGIEPSGPDVQAWIDGPEGAGNIALRLPHGVYGLDVDAYGDKSGAAALGELQTLYGQLPDTWVITSRDDCISGIRLFRAEMPVGRRWRDEPGGHGRGIEAIHYGHRYAVTWPSVHPDTGRKYVLRASADWMVFEGVAAVAELPELPPAWIEGLSEPGDVASGEAASHEATLAAVTAFPDGEPCERIREATARGLARLREARDGAALHPAGRDSTHELARLGHEGHSGARRALAEHYGAFVDVRVTRGADRRGAEAEWWRLARGAVGKLSGAPRHGCDCALLQGEGLLFDPGEPPGKAEGEAATSTIEVDLAGQLPVTTKPSLRDQLLTPRQLAERPPPVALVQGLLYLDTLAWLIGKSGSFKSFVALDIAQHVALGGRWAGRRVRQETVLYIVAEGAGGMRQRLHAWKVVNGEPDEDRMRFLDRAVQVSNSLDWNELIAAAVGIEAKLIILDTQARVTVGLKENDNTEMGQFVAQLDRLRAATGACVLVVHHIGRNGEDARGASALDGAQDTELKVERVGGPKAMTARLVTDKQKDGPDTESVAFEMRVIEVGEDDDGEPVTSLALNTNVFVDAVTAPWAENMSDKLGRILEVLRDSFSAEGGTGAEVLRILKERGWSKEYPSSSFYEAWNKLKEDQLIGRVAGSRRFAAMQIEPEKA